MLMPHPEYNNEYKKNITMVWLWPDYKFGFIAIQKNASTSIGIAIRATLGNKVRFDYVQNIPDIDNWSIYAITRHPIDRVISCYANKIIKKNIESGMYAAGFRPEMPFADYIDLIISIDDENCDKHVQSQYYRLVDIRGNKLTTNLFDMKEMKITNYELFRKLFQYKTDRVLIELKYTKKSKALSVNTAVNLYKKNTEKYNSLLYERYKKDFELLNYSFQDYKLPEIERTKRTIRRDALLRLKTGNIFLGD